MDKSLFARLCVTLMISHVHQRCTPRACTRGALLASAPEVHSSRLHQRRTPFACTRGIRACIRGALTPTPEAHSRLHQRRTLLACTKGTLFAPAPEAHSRLYQRRTTRAYASGASFTPSRSDAPVLVAHLHWWRVSNDPIPYSNEFPSALTRFSGSAEVPMDQGEPTYKTGLKE